MQTKYSYVDSDDKRVRFVAVPAEVLEVIEAIADQLCQLNDRFASIDNNLYTLVCDRKC